MKLAIISDTHFGDPMCSMFLTDPSTRKSKYEDFRNAAGENNDYLILLGDIFDFSIANYQEAYDASRVFFTKIANDNIAKEIIYVPGNHDFSAWHILMHEINFINRIKKCKEVAEQRWSCPAVLKDGDNPDDWLILPYVTHKQPERPKYGDVYLEYLTKANEEASPIPFNVAYPNIYMITDQGEGVLLTHGHYLESFWSFMGEFSRIIAQEDINLRYGNILDIEEFVCVNFPLNEIASSGIGQAGSLTHIARKIQQEVKDDNLKRVERYLDRFKSYADQCLSFKWNFIKEFISDKVLEELCKCIHKTLKEHTSSRYNIDFINKDEVRQRFLRYYTASTIESDLLNEKYGFGIPMLTKVIFGHIHEPIPYESPEPPRVFIESRGRGVTLFITGGWLWRTGWRPGDRVNAAVFTYESGKGFKSEVV